MHWVDLIIIAIVILSVVIGIFRGFIKESISLATWIIAIIIAWIYHPDLASVFEQHIDSPTLRLGIAFAILFVVTLIIGGLVNFALGELVDRTGLTGTDRTLGAVFGILRGILVVGVLVLLAGLTPLPKEPFWDQSLFLGYFERLAIWMRDFLPPDIASNFVYT
jgi:membrane protein required for colicin V production